MDGPSPPSPPSIPCATPHLEPAEVWQAILDAASERASVHTMISALTLVSLNPDRAVIGHAQRDRLTAEMALGHLAQLFERTLGRKVAVSLMQLKDAPRTAAPLPAPAAPSPQSHNAHPAQRNTAPAALPEPATAAARSAPVPPPAPRPMAPVDVEAAKANPLVQRAAELLSAKVVRITARNDPPQQQT